MEIEIMGLPVTLEWEGEGQPTLKEVGPDWVELGQEGNVLLLQFNSTRDGVFIYRYSGVTMTYNGLDVAQGFFLAPAKGVNISINRWQVAISAK